MIYFLNQILLNANFSKNVKNAMEPMQELILKYHIKNKRILSIGPGPGFEEHWFWKSGNSLTFVDIDESDVIEAFLKTLPEKASDGLTYYIGDAHEYVKNNTDEHYDLCYFSGFTLDELRRKEIQEKFKRFNPNIFIARSIRKLVKILNIPIHIAVRNWPKNEAPYMDLVINIANKFLRDGGLFISQSYAYSMNLIDNKHVVELMKNQFAKKNGIQLIKIYYFTKYPTTFLTIGYKGTREKAFKYMKSIEATPDIKKFHGRSEGEIDNAIEILFDLVKRDLPSKK